MTDEAYQAMLTRLSAMREKSKVVCAAKKAARAAPAEPEPEPEPAAPERSAVAKFAEQVEPVTFSDSQPPDREDVMPTPLPPPPRKAPARKARPIPIAAPPQPREMDEAELDRYFQAKYKWKTAYAAPPPQQAPPPQPMATAVRHTAQDQIRTRVNDEVMKMAMKSVFPDWA